MGIDFKGFTFSVSCLLLASVAGLSCGARSQHVILFVTATEKDFSAGRKSGFELISSINGKKNRRAPHYGILCIFCAGW